MTDPRPVLPDKTLLPPEEVAALRQLDKAHFWHPFTQMEAWNAPEAEPLVLAGGEGCWLFDVEGKRYLDGNASIWTNIHGHRHPEINRAIQEQLEKVAHVSALGTTNEPAIRLAAELARRSPGGALPHVFFTDDGSTAMECACKMAQQVRQLRGQPERTRFIAFDLAYHGDTAGAASLGGIGAFHERFRRDGFSVHHVTHLDELRTLPADQLSHITAVCIEPLIQGAAGMRLWPKGMLAELRQWCDEEGIFLILDEVMTGFGRTGTFFACEQENVIPDFLALAKGLTGGYLPLAATLTRAEIFESFLGNWESQRTFFYGHSYCGNALGAAAALASLKIFDETSLLSQHLPGRIASLEQALSLLSDLPLVSEIRQCGLMAGIDLMADPAKKIPFPPEAQIGARVCQLARHHGLLTRPIKDTLVLLPPLCITPEEINFAVKALAEAIMAVYES